MPSAPAVFVPTAPPQTNARRPPQFTPTPRFKFTSDEVVNPKKEEELPRRPLNELFQPTRRPFFNRKGRKDNNKKKTSVIIKKSTDTLFKNLTMPKSDTDDFELAFELGFGNSNDDFNTISDGQTATVTEIPKQSNLLGTPDSMSIDEDAIIGRPTFGQFEEVFRKEQALEQLEVEESKRDSGYPGYGARNPYSHVRYNESPTPASHGLPAAPPGTATPASAYHHAPTPAAAYDYYHPSPTPPPVVPHLPPIHASTVAPLLDHHPGHQEPGTGNSKYYVYNHIDGVDATYSHGTENHIPAVAPHPAHAAVEPQVPPTSIFHSTVAPPVHHSVTPFHHSTIRPPPVTPVPVVVHQPVTPVVPEVTPAPVHVVTPVSIHHSTGPPVLSPVPVVHHSTKVPVVPPIPTLPPIVSIYGPPKGQGPEGEELKLLSELPEVSRFPTARPAPVTPVPIVHSTGTPIHPPPAHVVHSTGTPIHPAPAHFEVHHPVDHHHVEHGVTNPDGSHHHVHKEQVHHRVPVVTPPAGAIADHADPHAGHHLFRPDFHNSPTPAPLHPGGHAPPAAAVAHHSTLPPIVHSTGAPVQPAAPVTSELPFVHPPPVTPVPVVHHHSTGAPIHPPQVPHIPIFHTTGPPVPAPIINTHHHSTISPVTAVPAIPIVPVDHGHHVDHGVHHPNGAHHHVHQSHGVEHPLPPIPVVPEHESIFGAKIIQPEHHVEEVVLQPVHHHHEPHGHHVEVLPGKPHLPPEPHYGSVIHHEPVEHHPKPHHHSIFDDPAPEVVHHETVEHYGPPPPVHHEPHHPVEHYGPPPHGEHHSHQEIHHPDGHVEHHDHHEHHHAGGHSVHDSHHAPGHSEHHNHHEVHHPGGHVEHHDHHEQHYAGGHSEHESHSAPGHSEHHAHHEIHHPGHIEHHEHHEHHNPGGYVEQHLVHHKPTHPIVHHEHDLHDVLHHPPPESHYGPPPPHHEEHHEPHYGPPPPHHEEHHEHHFATPTPVPVQIENYLNHQEEVHYGPPPPPPEDHYGPPPPHHDENHHAHFATPTPIPVPIENYLHPKDNYGPPPPPVVEHHVHADHLTIQHHHHHQPSDHYGPPPPITTHPEHVPVEHHAEHHKHHESHHPVDQYGPPPPPHEGHHDYHHPVDHYGPPPSHHHEEHHPVLDDVLHRDHGIPVDPYPEHHSVDHYGPPQRHPLENIYNHDYGYNKPHLTEVYSPVVYPKAFPKTKPAVFGAPLSINVGLGKNGSPIYVSTPAPYLFTTRRTPPTTTQFPTRPPAPAIDIVGPPPELGPKPVPIPEVALSHSGVLPPGIDPHHPHHGVPTPSPDIIPVASPTPIVPGVPPAIHFTTPDPIFGATLSPDETTTFPGTVPAVPGLPVTPSAKLIEAPRHQLPQIDPHAPPLPPDVPQPAPGQPIYLLISTGDGGEPQLVPINAGPTQLPFLNALLPGLKKPHKPTSRPAPFGGVRPTKPPRPTTTTTTTTTTTAPQPEYEVASEAVDVIPGINPREPIATPSPSAAQEESRNQKPFSIFNQGFNINGINTISDGIHATVTAIPISSGGADRPAAETTTAQFGDKKQPFRPSFKSIFDDPITTTTADTTLPTATDTIPTQIFNTGTASIIKIEKFGSKKQKPNSNVLTSQAVVSKDLLRDKEKLQETILDMLAGSLNHPQKDKVVNKIKQEIHKSGRPEIEESDRNLVRLGPHVVMTVSRPDLAKKVEAEIQRTYAGQEFVGLEPIGKLQYDTREVALLYYY